MKFKITQPGVFDENGEEIEIGTELDVKGDDVPKALVNKCEVIGKPSKDAVAVTNDDGLAAKHRGGGRYSIMDGETEVMAGLSKADAEAFNSMSDEDKKAYVDATKE